MRKLLLILALSICLFPAKSLAESTIHKHTLDNGMTVLITEMPSNPMVSVYALVKAGSATEGKYLGSGITHYLEHMLFKETKNRGVGEISKAIQSVGGSINASTGMDYTIYTITVPKDAFDTALDILADMLMNTIFSEEELAKERDVVLKEMILHEDNPSRQLIRKVYESVFNTHPYQNPIIGYRPTFLKISKEDVEDYFQTHYLPNNIILSIAGNVMQKDVLPKVNDMFSEFNRQYEIVRHLPKEPEQIAPRYIEEFYESKVTRAALAYRSVKLLDQDLFALDVLAMILGQGRSSRLLRDLYYDKQLVSSISAWNHTPMDEGIFTISMVVENENLAGAISAVEEHIAKIQKSGVTKTELKKAKKQVLSDYLMDKQTTASVAYSQAMDEAFTGDHNFGKTYLTGIEGVTNEDITRVANQYLVEQTRTQVVLKPFETEEMPNDVDKASQIGQIEKHVLDNGLTILLREDDTFEVASARVLFNGGLREETADMNGISSMMAKLLVRGTKRKDVNQINEYVDSLGMVLGVYSGRNSVGIDLDFLKEDENQAIDFVYELIGSSTLPEEEIQKVKEDMLVAIRQRDDSIFKYSARKMLAKLYPTHPFQMDQGGTVESIEKITRDQLEAFYKRVTVPSNMIVTVFGNIDKENVLAKLKDTFGQIKPNEYTVSKFNEAPLANTIEATEQLDKAQAVVLFGFHGLNMTHPDKYGLEVATAILGSSFSGRLFSHIRDELGKAYTLGGMAIPSLDTGFVYFYALTAPENAEEVKELIKQEIQTLQNELVSDEDLMNIKNYLKGRDKEGLQTNSDLSFVSGLDELYGLGFNDYRNYDANIDAVTKKQIKKAANTYFDLQRCVIQVTLPPEKEK